MWTAGETLRILRAHRGSILRDWQENARTQWSYQTPQQFSRGGPVYACANETLTALEAFYNVHAAPSSTNGAASNRPLAPPAALSAPVLAQRAARWAALSHPWPDVQAMMRLVTTAVSGVLEAQSADRETLLHNAAVLESLISATADLRLLQLEQELATNREEAVMTQHLAGRFLSNASHELRTPLTAVLGFSELLLEETYGALTPEQRTTIGHINDSAQNLSEIVNNLLDLLHIRAGKLQLNFRLMEVAPVLRNLYELLLALAKRKNVDFTLDLPDDLGAIEMDENIVRHSVYHLLSSALRATPTNGKVLLSARREATVLTILTHDTAMHLPPEAVANMLGPFPLLENSPVRGYEGWEVGLPLVRRYVDLHGGKLEMESLPGQGTIFRIVLPIAHDRQN